MVDWSIPSTIKQLRGFMGLTRHRIGDVFQQAGHPVAYPSKTLAPKHHSLSAYEKSCHGFRRVERITTPFQSKWLPKLLGFDYEIVYKKRKEKRKSCCSCFVRINTGGELSTMNIQDGNSSFSKYSWSGGQLRRKGKLMVGSHDAVRRKLVNRLRKIVKQVVRRCDVYQRNKADLAAYPDLLHPLLIPQQVWQDIYMDFIDGLPMSNGKIMIMVYGHFILMAHPYTATQVAQLSLDNVYKLHGLPRTKVRDYVFTSLFGKSLFKMLKVELQMSSAYHLHTVSQSTKTTPFEFLYGETRPQDDGLIVVSPITVLDRRLMKKKNGAMVYLLIQWSNSSIEDAT
ncbi:putative mitochondrial protein [Tanacetum coccineum]